jgi:hypothetical protein
MIRNKPHKCLNPDCDKSGFYQMQKGVCSHRCRDIVYGKPEQKPRGRIKPISDKQLEANDLYRAARVIFLARPENARCFITGCNKRATTIEHRKGRRRDQYADDEARIAGIPLLLDERFWAPCCFAHNGELENNTELSRAHQLSRIHNGTKGQGK